MLTVSPPLRGGRRGEERPVPSAGGVCAPAAAQRDSERNPASGLVLYIPKALGDRWMNHRTGAVGR